MAAGHLLLVIVFSINASFVVLSPKMNFTKTTPNVIEGETTSFICTVDERNVGFLMWHLNDKPLEPSSCSGLVDLKQICLDITLYRNYSGFTLTCSTQGEFKNINKTKQLNVLHPPDVVTLDANLTSGLIYKFNCTASGANPAVKITWLTNKTNEKSREVNVLRLNPATYMWTTSSCITLHTHTQLDVEGVKCMTSFLDNDSYIVRELPLDSNIKGTGLITKISTAISSSTTQPVEPDKGTSKDKSTNAQMFYVIVSISAAVCLCVVVVIVWRLVRKPKPQQPPSINEDSEYSSSDCVELEESGFQLPDVDYNFPRENIELLEVLGCGNFGQVYKAIATDILEVGTKSLVAVKILKKSSSCDLEADFQKEVSVHKSLTKHPYVVSMLGYCTEIDPFYLILEFLPGGNLQDYLRKKRVSWKESKEEDRDVEAGPSYQLLEFASQIANGMDYLSFMGVLRQFYCLLATSLKQYTCEKK